MWSGKTTELLRLYDRKRHAGIKCLLIKHSIDQRYQAGAVVTHINSYGVHNRATAMIFASISDVMSHLQTYGNASLFIDEIQFFPDKERCVELMDMGIDVVAAGLNGDYNRRMFAGMEILVAAATDIKLLSAVCGLCKSDNACYSMRLSGSSDIIDVGGADKYVAVCLRCYKSKDEHQ